MWGLGFFRKQCFTCMGAHFLVFCYVVFVFCVSWRHLENSSFVSMWVQFWEPDRHVLFFMMWGNVQNQVSTCLSFSRLFLISGAFLQALEPYGRPKASLWASIRSIRWWRMFRSQNIFFLISPPKKYFPASSFWGLGSRMIGLGAIILAIRMIILMVYNRPVDYL